MVQTPRRALSNLCFSSPAKWPPSRFECDMNAVMEIGQNIALLHQGNLAWKGNRKEVLDSDNELLDDFIFASPFLQKLRDRAMNNGVKGLFKREE